MMWYSDDALWHAAEASLSTADQKRLAQLNEVADERPLSDAERTELQTLIELYDRAVLRRAKALAMLAEAIPFPTVLPESTVQGTQSMGARWNDQL